MKLCRALLAAAVAACMVPSPREAAAQIDPGSYELMLYSRTGRNGSAGLTRFAEILVVEGERAGEYRANTEYWYVTPSLLPRDPDIVVEIVPIRGPGQDDSAPPPVGEYVYEANAKEADLGSDADLDVLMDREEHGDRATEFASTTEIWQCWNCPIEEDGDTDRFELVGVIYGYLLENGDPIEHWLLSADYVYPNVAVPVRTQLRPTVAAADSTPRAFLRGAAGKLAAARYIRVETRTMDVSSLPPPTLVSRDPSLDSSGPGSCGLVGHGAPRGPLSWFFGFAGAVAALVRRRRRACRG